MDFNAVYIPKDISDVGLELHDITRISMYNLKLYFVVSCKDFLSTVSPNLKAFFRNEDVDSTNRESSLYPTMSTSTSINSSSKVWSTTFDFTLTIHSLPSLAIILEEPLELGRKFTNNSMGLFWYASLPSGLITGSAFKESAKNAFSCKEP